MAALIPRCPLCRMEPEFCVCLSRGLERVQSIVGPLTDESVARLRAAKPGEWVDLTLAEPPSGPRPASEGE